MKAVIACVVSLFVFTGVLSSAWAEEAGREGNLRVAVVGAGPSGLTAARTLVDMGCEAVTVFEKENDVGGKVLTYVHDGRPYELGAIIANHQYQTVLSFAHRYDLDVTKVGEALLVDRHGNVFTYPNFATEFYGVVPLTTSLFNFAWTMMSHRDIGNPGFWGLDEELHQPMSEFASSHHIESAVGMVQSFMTGCGYGYYDEVPALYLMKLIPWLVSNPFEELATFGLMRGWSTFDRGWQQLWRDVAADLDVRLSSEVTRVERSEEGGRSRVLVTAGGFTQEFDRIVVAAPLEKAGLFLDLSDEERDLFGRIRNLRYLVTLVEGEGLFQASYYDNVTPDTIGHLNFIVQQHPDTDVFMLYQLLDEDMTPEEAWDIAQGDVAPLGGRVTRVLTHRLWSYFPQVGTKDLDAGYYERLEALQGARGTYYVGGLMSFETVEHVARYAQELMEEHFSCPGVP